MVAKKKTETPEIVIDEIANEVKEEVKEEKAERKAVGTVGGTPVMMGSGFIKTKAYKSPVPMYVLPDEIKNYLRNKGLGTNVFEKPKAWLEAHHVDMEIVAKLKKFISDNYS